jgi:pilus assembly protein Flp/PilA
MPAKSDRQGAMPLIQFASRFIKDESGATAIEYGLIAALIALVIVTAVTSIGTKIGATFNNVKSKLP